MDYLDRKAVAQFCEEIDDRMKRQEKRLDEIERKFNSIEDKNNWGWQRTIKDSRDLIVGLGDAVEKLGYLCKFVSRYGDVDYQKLSMSKDELKSHIATLKKEVSKLQMHASHLKANKKWKLKELKEIDNALDRKTGPLSTQ